MGGDKTMRVPRLWAFATAAALALGTLATAAAPASAGAVPHRADTSGATKIIISSNTQFGKVLAVGNGPFAGFSVYFITSDFGHHFGCTDVLLHLVIGPIQCTGPATNTNVEWPAVFTSGKPVAGPGVKASLLGEVFRKGMGEQVTYAGHPLYLFDQAPGLVSGQDVNEPGLPPWHGLWTLIHPNGLAAAEPGQLTTTVINGKTVLAALYETGAGPIAFPVYRYSRDTRTASKCQRGACARTFPAVLTNGFPGVSASLFRKGKIATLSTAQGTQVSWDRHPLYLFSNETLFAGGVFHPVGNGNGVVVNGGTFHLIRV
jgi:predicted lipoprotein with Yx(FWY)xxD motif